MGFLDWLFGRKRFLPPHTPPSPVGPRNPNIPTISESGTAPVRPPAGGQSQSGQHSLGSRYNPRILRPRHRRSSRPREIDAGKSEHLDRWPHDELDRPDPASLTLPAPRADWVPLGDQSALAALLGIQPTDLKYWLVGHHLDENYILREIPKKSGGTRLLMAPMPRLKALQRQLQQALVSRLPLSPSVHGFRRRHDVLTNAAVHVGKRVVVCMDIADFFPSFDLRRVCGYFRWLGYSRSVALSLASLTTADSFNARLAKGRGRTGLSSDWTERNEVENRCQSVNKIHRTSPLRYRGYRLPQGAPTSPGIANAIVWRMDKRLSALARKFGGDYTRYADDLTFSGFEKLAKHTRMFIKLVEKIVHTEGLAINRKKTRIMRSGRRQRVTGVVVNRQTNLARRDFDLLKAILHNCITKGPSTQNRSNHPNFREHLRGRVAHALHIGPERGAKLQQLFNQIDWSR